MYFQTPRATHDGVACGSLLLEGGGGSCIWALPDECGLARLVQWLYLVLRF